MKNKFKEIDFTISAEEYEGMEKARRELSFRRGEEVNIDDFIDKLVRQGIKKIKKEIITKNIAA